VLFDLDGTLVDTVADITCALNVALSEQQLGRLSESEARRMIGRGVPVLIERAVARLAPQRAVDTAQLLKRYEQHYDALYAQGELRARVFPGVAQGLAQLHGAGYRLAVVTNKFAAAAAKLLEHMHLAPWLDALVGGDSGLPRKPHPAPLLRACEELEVSPAAALMVGDSQVDVAAARAAGRAVVCVSYGYNEGADPRSLAADGFIDSLAELPALLGASSLRCANAAP
jgi:phosphoglycolate phosphatase